LKAVAGLVHPSSGDVRFEGRPIGRLPAHRVARLGIGTALLIGYMGRPKNSLPPPLLEFAREQAPNDGDVRAALDRLDREKH
jgi:hypothetical protein